MPSNNVHSEEQSLSYKLALQWIDENNLAGLVDLIQNNLTLDEGVQLISTHAANEVKQELQHLLEVRHKELVRLGGNTDRMTLEELMADRIQSLNETKGKS